MEYKMLEKNRVVKKLSITDIHLEKIIKKMMKRHPNEKWIVKRVSNNGEKFCYLKLEFVNWIEEVYFNKKEYYLDAEIKFFKKQIKRLERELKVLPREIEYYDLPLRQLKKYFGKSQGSIGKAINKMCKSISSDCKYKKDGIVMITKEGVKWLNEKYFREAYLKDLELYKIELQKRKLKINE